MPRKRLQLLTWQPCQSAVTNLSQSKWRIYKHDRSLAQNRLSHKWYSEVSLQGKEYTPEEVKSIAKLRWGVPILLAESEEFAAFWKLATATSPTYEQQREIIMPHTPITSLMSVEQMSRYLSDFLRVMGSKYQLTDPALLGLEI